MSSHLTHLKALKRNFDEFFAWDGSKTGREKLITNICSLYENLGREAVNEENDRIYSLFDLSTHIFRAALQECAENNSKWEKDREKENKSGAKGIKTRLFELSVYHLKNCCQRELDPNDVAWIKYLLAVLDHPWIRNEVSMESEVSTSLLTCSSSSKLHWEDHSALRRLWQFLWTRIADRRLDISILKNYVELAVRILKTVDVSIFGTSSVHVVKHIVGTLKAVSKTADVRFWTHSRKYSFVHILSYIVHRWGLEARDFILTELFGVVENLMSLVSVEQSTSEGDSKKSVMRLIDDLIKLATVETIGTHRTMSKKTEEDVRRLLRVAIADSLKSAHTLYFNKASFVLADEYVRYLARWMIAERSLNPDGDDHDSMKKQDAFSLKGLLDLSFGANIVPNLNKCNAWNGAMRILEHIVAGRTLDGKLLGRVLETLWTMRKSFATDTLRSTFCALLATSVSQDVRFGHQLVPSVDLLLKYALSLMPNLTSLPNSARLVESILRHRQSEVPKEMMRAICDTVSRTHPSSRHAVRLVAAFMAYTEFDEHLRFSSTDNEEKGGWRLRKDIIDWLLTEPGANCSLLIRQLCRYHPEFGYDLEERNDDDDSLLKSLKLCNLVKNPEKPIPQQSPPTKAVIEELTVHVHAVLQNLLETETTFEVFMIAQEFSMDHPEFKFEFYRYYSKVQTILDEWDRQEFLTAVDQIARWPDELTLPANKHDTDCLMAYLFANLHNPSVDWTPWLDRKQELIELSAERARCSETARQVFQQAIPFNSFVKRVILENPGDLYETTRRFVDYSFLLSHRNMIAARDVIIKQACEQLDAGESICDADMTIFENLTTGACVRNVSGMNRMDGYELTASEVALHANRVLFDDRSVVKYLKELKSSPFLAQNIVRNVLENGRIWHLHGIMLRVVMRDERLLTVCISTIPNMIRYLKVYQIEFPTKWKTFGFLRLNEESVRKCQKYIRKPKENAESITPDDLNVLLGIGMKQWKRVVFRFWKLFEKDPALVCERLHQFATECVQLRLSHRLATLLKAITIGEMSKRVLNSSRHLRDVYNLIYRSIFCIIVEHDLNSDIVELCCDEKLKYDLFEHRIGTIPPSHADAFMNFETNVAFSIENFLKFGTESENVDFADFGLVEFYKQLDENLTEDVIRSECIIDFLVAVWLDLPTMRRHIVPIVARFKHVSPAWSRFPQPPHTTPSTEMTFVWKLRFRLSLKLQNGGGWRRGELATFVTLLLMTHRQPCRRIQAEARGKGMMCVMSRMLAREATPSDKEERVLEETLFRAVIRAAGVIPDIAAIVVPFLFKVCVDVKCKYDMAIEKLLESLKGIQKESQQEVFCLAECVDSIGLNVMARLERLNDSSAPKFASRWYFSLANLFLAHGFLTHAFAVANLIFDRLTLSRRNMMMVERITLDTIPESAELIDLLVGIHVAEGNAVALSSLPPSVQTRSDVRQVVNKKAGEWLRLVSSNCLDLREATLARWMCGLQSENAEVYLDAVLRARFDEYPKKIDTPSKFVYFVLYHLAINTEVSFSNIMSNMIGSLKIDDVRLVKLACDEANFEPRSIEERVVLAVRNLRATCGKRKRADSEVYAREVNEKTGGMVQLAQTLAENNAHEAASQLLKKWKDECTLWQSDSNSIDTALIDICDCDVMCQSGDARMAEIRLREMQPRVSQMSDAALAEWVLVLSKITLDYRNDVDEGVRLLETGCGRLLKRDSVDARLKVLLRFHEVCITQLTQLEEYRETRSFRMKLEAVSALEQQIQNSAVRPSRINSGDEEAKRVVGRVKKEHQCEKYEVERVESSVLTAALKAIASAFDALDCISQLDDDKEAMRVASLIIFPLIDVIYKYESCQQVGDLLKHHAPKLTTKLWLCATSHIASKCFATSSSPLRRQLCVVLTRLIVDYPFHVMHTVLMYTDARVDTFLKSVVDRNSARDSAKLGDVIGAMKEAHSAYREFARLKDGTNCRLQRISVDGKSLFRVPPELKMFKCKLKHLPIPTISQKIGRPRDYSTTGLVTWKSWKGVFSLADGLSAPKIWEIEGSDGRWYKTVWKTEDVRQDVLVEQMFDVTNNVLADNTLRTYNVVPLDTTCGIIEFCGGTVSLKEMLCGVSRDKGLHQEFNAKEPSALEVSKRMRECQNDSTETRRRVFLEICKDYSPVFRHFFYTNFPMAHIWREKLIEYRKSLAMWSVVCYIVGLGDRHASNILFDQKLCTFVHIDLGMILEYSKRSLPIPEKVPFRISRDLLDPILIEGIENGQLADDCTQAMEKLKQNRKVILGVASALLRETMTNFRETEQFHGRPSYISEMAIGRLRDKLAGTDDGVTAQSSNLQVRRLLREATNADNLARMFCGWMPFL